MELGSKVQQKMNYILTELAVKLKKITRQHTISPNFLPSILSPTLNSRMLFGDQHPTIGASMNCQLQTMIVNKLS